MALDYQTLLTAAAAAGYGSAGRVAEKQMLRLALLQSIANTLAPSMATDYQSLLNIAQVPGYRAAANASVADLLEFGLLNIIATNAGATITGTADPTGTAGTGQLYLNTTTNTLWAYNGGWKMLV